jgi:hypothetical protein
MDTNSPRPNWDQLTDQARQAAAPVDLDVRHAIRQQISAPASPPVTQSGLWDELLALGGARWLQGGLTCLVAAAGWTCWQGLATLNELALLWSLEAPFLALY